MSLLEKQREARKLRRKLRSTKAALAAHENKLKKLLLAGVPLEPGRLTARLRLLPGRDPQSRNPDDYKLVVAVGR